MNSINTMINLLNNQLIICDDNEMLILLFKICNDLNNIRQTLIYQFINTLQECVFNCLNNNNVRHYFYFKKYLLLSNVLLCKYYSNNNNELLFDMIDNLVNTQLIFAEKNIFIIIFQIITITIIVEINWYF